MKSTNEPSSRPVMPDDNEPITKEWLEKVCYAQNDADNFGFESDEFWFEIEFDEDGKFICFMAGNEITTERIKTRGDVRDVCWFIGCEWFGECWGEP